MRGPSKLATGRALATAPHASPLGVLFRGGDAGPRLPAPGLPVEVEEGQRGPLATTNYGSAAVVAGPRLTVPAWSAVVAARLQGIGFRKQGRQRLSQPSLLEPQGASGN